MESSKKENQIWKAGYVNVYDTIAQYQPYKDHLSVLVNKLELRDGLSLLDLGCGTGQLLKKCKAFTAALNGVDSSEAMLARSRALVESARLYLHDLSLPLPFESNTFDRVVSNNVLSYLENPDMFAREVVRVLKPGGIFLVATLKPNFNPWIIFCDHVKSSGVKGFLQTFVPSLLVGYYNKKIVNALKSKRFTGYDQGSIEQLFEKSGAKNLTCFESYSLQDVVIKGTKC